MKTKRPKHYPMDGPTILAQRLMFEGPRRNHAELRVMLKDIKRDETKAVLDLR
jgi:hypothetical protein